MADQIIPSDLLDNVTTLLQRQYGVIGANSDFISGSIDDPNSFNETGGKDGALGYYPLVNVDGSVFYFPCQARLMALALGGANAETLAQILASANASIAAVNAATGAANGAATAANTSAANADQKAIAAQTVVDAAAAILAAKDASVTASGIAVDAKAQAIAIAASIANIISNSQDFAQITANQQTLVNPLSVVIKDIFGNAVGGVDAAGAFFTQFLKVLGGGASFGGDVNLLGHILKGLASPSSDDHAVNRGFMNAAIAAAIAALPSPIKSLTGDQVATSNVQGLVNPIAVTFQDINGNTVAGVDGSAALFAQTLKVLAGGLFASKINIADFGNILMGLGTKITSANGVTISFAETNYDVSICDVNGYPLAGWLNGKFYGPSASNDSIILDEQDALNKAYTSRVNMRRIRSVQLPTANYNLQFLYGQSLAQGDQTHPALSTVNKYGNLMLGGNVMSSTDNAVYTPFGGSTLQPLIANTVNGSTKYDATAEASLPTTDGSRGEPANIGWTNGSKPMLNDKLMVFNDTSRLFVSINIAKSGATIGELEKNHTEGSTEMYGKYPSALSQIMTIAGTASVAITGIMYMQGEFDYVNNAPHNSTHLTYATYYPTLTKLASDMQADAVATTGQARPPAFLIYQTGAAYTRDVDVNGLPGLHIGMAQLNFALTAPNAWMVGPVYPLTDRGGHLDSNGSRWFGHQIAKVWNRVVLEGRDWEPLRPLRIWMPDKQTIYVNYHVPEPPLVFDSPYVVNTPTMFATKGYRVTDSSGNVGISAVDIVRDTIIRITLSRAVVGVPNLWYAGQATFNGNGNIRDSDPSLASENYTFIPNRGMADAENIAALVDKPYPLWNWGIAFYYPADGSTLYSQ